MVLNETKSKIVLYMLKVQVLKLCRLLSQVTISSTIGYYLKYCMLLSQVLYVTISSSVGYYLKFCRLLSQVR